MAFEATSYLHAALKYDGTVPGIVARTGIASVVRNGAGDYTVNLTNAIGDNAEVRNVAIEGAIPLYMMVTRTSPTSYRILVLDFSDPVDARVNVSFYALTNRS